MNRSSANSTVKAHFFCFLAVLFFLGLTGCSATLQNTPFNNPILIWSDEFNDDSLDLTKWSRETGYGHDDSGWGNDEWQLYTDSADNAYLEDGKLVISARCDSGECAKRDGSITSARLHTSGKFSYRYGRVQARIKPPKGIGTWAAFWQLGDAFGKVGWPRCGEIDIMEMHYKYSNPSTVNAAAHWWDDTLNEDDKWTYSYDHKSFDHPLGDEFHIYEMAWTSETITALIDGQPYYTQLIDAATMNEFQSNCFLILNVAVGGNLGGNVHPETTWPQNMYVDWVRVYGEAQ